MAKAASAFRLSDAAHRRIAAIAAQEGISKTAALESAIRDLAARIEKYPVASKHSLFECPMPIGEKPSDMTRDAWIDFLRATLGPFASMIRDAAAAHPGEIPIIYPQVVDCDGEDGLMVRQIVGGRLEWVKE